MAASKIFFSYSRLDSDFALQLAKDIRASGVDIWIDQLDIQAGNHWDAAVEKALATSACVLVILTPSSTSSTNVMDEVSFALESGKKIIPVMLEDCLPPFRLRRLQRIDFTKDYKAGLTQLLAAIDQPVPAKVDVAEGSDPAPQVVIDPQKKEKENAEMESRMWDTACKLNTIAAYEKYLKDSVTGEFKAEAQLLIHQLTLEQKEDELDTAAWKKAKAEHTLQSYQLYLKSYPDRNYKSLALAAIAEIEEIHKEELRKQEAKRKEEQLIEEKKKEEARQDAKRQEEKRQAEKREEARLLEEKRKEEKKLEEQKKIEKRAEDQRQEDLRKEQKKQESLKKEKEKEEQKKLAAQQAAASGTTVAPKAEAGSSGKKILFIGTGVAIVALLIWLLLGNSSAKKRDEKAWADASQQKEINAYSAYLAQFPKGEYATIAEHRVDSIRASRQAEQDATTAALAKSKQDSIAAASVAAATPAKTQTPAKTETPVTKVKPTPTTTNTPAKVVSPYKLGQAFGGGVVAFIDQTGQHGLIAAEKDLGYLPHDNATKKASKFTGGNNHDWRLPKKEELIALYQARKTLNIDTHGSYWSSTPDKDNFIWSLNMGDGKFVSFNKTTALFVRAVRPF